MAHLNNLRFGSSKEFINRGACWCCPAPIVGICASVRPDAGPDNRWSQFFCPDFTGSREIGRLVTEASGGRFCLQ